MANAKPTARQTQNRQLGKRKTDSSANAKPKLGKRKTEARQTQNRSSANAKLKLGKRKTEARQTQNRSSANAKPKLGKRKTEAQGQQLEKMLPTNALPTIVANPTHKTKRAA